MNDVDQIRSINKHLENFWGNAHNWAPVDAAEMLSRSMLRWQSELSDALLIWMGKTSLTEGELILAWANLGSLIEGTVKLFLCIHLNDYNAHDEIDKMKKYQSVILPDEATLETLKQFCIKQGLFTNHIALIGLVQRNRNKIHSFKQSSIDDFEAFKAALKSYAYMLDKMNTSLPYPDDIYAAY